MKITPKFNFISGSIETKTAELVCVHNKNHRSIHLCLKSNMNISFAEIKLHSRGLFKDADAVFDDAARFGDEIARRWNESINKQ